VETVREALRYGRPIGMGSNDQALDALDLVEAALDAAEKVCDELGRQFHDGSPIDRLHPELRAALQRLRGPADGPSA
jgi:hypothetical protein